MYTQYRTPSRRVKDFLKDRLRSLFELGQRLGVDILPRHFYSSIPDMRQLRAEDSWRMPYSMAGVRGADLREQFSFVRQCCSEELVAVQRQRDIFREAVELSGELGYVPGDAEFLFCFIATFRPPEILQVGCGVSTAVMQLAARHAGYQPVITCIEPYPSAYLRAEQERGAIRLLPQKAESVDVQTYSALGTGGLLFIDSTHTLRPGGEVPKIILEVLPRLGAGRWVHFHDVWFPYDYAPNTLTGDLFFWKESLLLHAFLVGNRKYRLSASLSMLYHSDFQELNRFLPTLRPCTSRHGELGPEERYPVSAYLQVVED